MKCELSHCKCGKYLKEKKKMPTKLTVKRAALIKSIEAKATENQKTYDDAIKALPKQSDICAAMNETIRTLTKNGTNVVPATGYNQQQLEAARNTFLTYCGIPIVKIAEPKLFKKELAVLKMAEDDTLVIDDSSDYFSFLK